RIVLAEQYAADAVAKLRTAGDVVEITGNDVSALRAALTDADALLVRTYTAVTDDLLAAAPKLKVIGRGGVGLDNIDVNAAHTRGITVVYTPAASTRSVAEHTWGLILAVMRNLVGGDQAVRGGTFLETRSRLRFRELGDLALGIVGMGRIGSNVGRIAALGFGMRVAYTDIAPVGPFDFAADAVSFEQLLAESDVLSLHVPLTPATRDMIRSETLAHVRPGAILINTARGSVVNAAALADALRSGRLAGAAIDVFDSEPPAGNHPLLNAPNLLLSPHVAGRSAVAVARMNDVVDDVVRVLAGEPAAYPAPHTGW
ncbi:MAG TPA: NAD(P)-dependent oxidoreductase, partial [Phycisphaerae bacterium]|nr:NAD(P)-dependent oxidoreductase [Phycisphaerae bacterium]